MSYYHMALDKFFTKLFKAVSKAHHPIEFNMIWKAMLIPSLGYIVGLILGMFYYRKPREYKQKLMWKMRIQLMKLNRMYS